MIIKNCSSCENRKHVMLSDDDEDNIFKDFIKTGLNYVLWQIPMVGHALICLEEARENCPHHKWGKWINPADIQAYTNAANTK
jgi:hypothetical protein